MSRYAGFSKMGFTLSGRNALYLYGLTSLDDSVVFIESNSTGGMLRGVCVVPESENPKNVRGFKCASLEKAMIDFMKYPYDDSGVIEASEMLDEQEIMRVVAYAKNTNNTHLLNDFRWAEFFEAYL